MTPAQVTTARERMKAGGRYYDISPAPTGDTVTTMPVRPPGPRPTAPGAPGLAPLPQLQLPTMGEAPTLEMPAAPGMPGGAELPTIEMPEMGRAEFQAPEWSEQAITALAQKRAAPGVRGLKEGLREVTAQMGNDPISRHTAREALGGYGRGLGEVMAGAHSAAVQEYSQKYGYEFQGAAMQFESEADAIAREYQGKLATNMAEYEGKLQGIMAGYQAQVAGAGMEYQAAFNMMMRQYEVEAQASMLKYETGARRQEVQAELEFKASAIDFDAAMQDYMAQYGQVTTETEGGGWGDTGAGWAPPPGSPGAAHAWFVNRTGFGQGMGRSPFAAPTGRPAVGSGTNVTARARTATARQSIEEGMSPQQAYAQSLRMS